MLFRSVSQSRYPAPFYIPSGVSFTNYANSQVLFAEEIAVDGELVIEGHMLDVTPPSPPLTNYWGNSSGSNFWASAPNTTSVSAIAGSTLSLAIGDNSHSYDNALAIGHSSSAAIMVLLWVLGHQQVTNSAMPLVLIL